MYRYQVGVPGTVPGYVQYVCPTGRRKLDKNRRMYFDEEVFHRRNYQSLVFSCVLRRVGRKTKYVARTNAPDVRAMTMIQTDPKDDEENDEFNLVFQLLFISYSRNHEAPIACRW